MRTLHADLTTAQKASSATPYVKLTFTSRDRGTTRTYQTTDATNRIRSVQQTEGRFGAGMQVPGSPYNLGAIVRLADHDKSLNVLDYKGYRLDISWGFNVSGTPLSSEGEPLYVINQRSISEEGILDLELWCVSLWEMIRIFWLNTTTGAPVTWGGNTAVSKILTELLGGTAPTKVWRFVTSGSVWEDQTTAAGDQSSIFYPWQLSPAPAVDDIWYLGGAKIFDTLTYHCTVAKSGVTVVGEYWNGSAWTTASFIDAVSNKITTDPGDDASLRIVKWAVPSNWATTAVNGVTAYWIRWRVSAISSPSAATFQRAFIGLDFGVVLSTSASGQGDDYTPRYSSGARVNIQQTLIDILSNTLLGVVLEKNLFNVRYVDNTQSTPDYTYNTGDHQLYYAEVDNAVVIPNKITYADLEPSDEGLPVYEGSDENTTASGQIGTIEELRFEGDIGSNANAVTLAEREIQRLARDSFQASINVPMNCGQEIWDLVRVIDTRSGITSNGRVSQLIRIFDNAGVYRLQITMGGRLMSVAPWQPLQTITETLSDRNAAIRAESIEITSQEQLILNRQAFELLKQDQKILVPETFTQAVKRMSLAPGDPAMVLGLLHEFLNPPQTFNQRELEEMQQALLNPSDISLPFRIPGRWYERPVTPRAFPPIQLPERSP